MRRLGPVGASLAAAALTAAAFAAISVAQNGGSDGADGPGPGERIFELRAGHPPHLSEEDRAAMESFRNCMEENGADLPHPPAPGELKDGEMPAPPEPPTESEREAIDEALEACEDKLPEGAHFGIGPCGSDDDSEGEDDGSEGEDEGAREDSGGTDGGAESGVAAAA